MGIKNISFASSSFAVVDFKHIFIISLSFSSMKENLLMQLQLQKEKDSKV